MSYNFRQFLSLTKTMKIGLGTHISKVFSSNQMVFFFKMPSDSPILDFVTECPEFPPNIYFDKMFEFII